MRNLYSLKNKLLPFDELLNELEKEGFILVEEKINFCDRIAKWLGLPYKSELIFQNSVNLEIRILSDIINNNVYILDMQIPQTIS